MYENNKMFLNININFRFAGSTKLFKTKFGSNSLDTIPFESNPNIVNYTKKIFQIMTVTMTPKMI